MLPPPRESYFPSVWFATSVASAAFESGGGLCTQRWIRLIVPQGPISMCTHTVQILMACIYMSKYSSFNQVFEVSHVLCLRAQSPYPKYDQNCIQPHNLNTLVHVKTLIDPVCVVTEGHCSKTGTDSAFCQGLDHIQSIRDQRAFICIFLFLFIHRFNQIFPLYVFFPVS